MSINLQRLFGRGDRFAVNGILGLLIATWWCSAAPIFAAETLVYTFETGIEGFTNNGTGTTVSLDTIGATDGAQSMKVAITGPTFVGALTDQLHPAIGDPPGLDHVLFDLTFTEPFPEGSFAVVGITVFGVDQQGFDVQLQTGPSLDNEELEWHIDGREPGTYRDIRMDMTLFEHPVTFVPATFNDIVGTQGSGPNDVIPTGFQLYFNKSGGLESSLTVYIDNIRAGMTEEALAGDHNQDGKVDAADYVTWRKDPEAFGGDPDGYTVWREHFGEPVAGSGGSSAVPEPASMVLVIAAGWLSWGTLRQRTR